MADGPKAGGVAAARRRRGWFGRLGLLILGLAACGDPRANPAWTLGGEPGLLYTIKQYYESHALEENGRCTAPILEGVTHSEVTQTDHGNLTVDVGYAYRDGFGGDDDCSRQQPLRCGIMRSCRGFAERQFVVAKDNDQLKVIEMNGSQRGNVYPQ